VENNGMPAWGAYGAGTDNINGTLYYASDVGDAQNDQIAENSSGSSGNGAAASPVGAGGSSATSSYCAAGPNGTPAGGAVNSAGNTTSSGPEFTSTGGFGVYVGQPAGVDEVDVTAWRFNPAYGWYNPLATAAGGSYGGHNNGAYYGGGTASRSRSLSMGVLFSVSTIPFTSGGGNVQGWNYQYVPGIDQEWYKFSGSGQGLNVGASLQSSWAWGSGPWTGPFNSVNVSAAVITGSVYWTPGPGGWIGFSFGLSGGLPVGLSYETTNYSYWGGH
jgi:hypothetical protein